MTFYSPKYYKEQRKSAALDRMDKPLYQINKSEDEVITVAKNNWELDVIGNINEGYKAWLDAGNEGSRQNYLDSLSIEELKTLSYKKGG